MKKKLTTIATLALLSSNIMADAGSTPSEEINPNIEGVTTEEAAAALDKAGQAAKDFATQAVEVGKKVAEAINNSIEEVTFGQTLDGQDGRAELSYTAGVKGTIYEEVEGETLSDKFLMIDVEYNKNMIELYESFIADYQETADEAQEDIDNARSDFMRNLAKSRLANAQSQIDIYQEKLDNAKQALEELEDRIASKPSVTYQMGLYNVEIALNAISNESPISLQEAYIHALGMELKGRFGEVSFYGAGLKAERFEESGRSPIMVASLTAAGIEYELHIQLTDDGKVKLLLAGGAEFGATFEPTGDGLYLNSYGKLGVQIGDVIIEAVTNGRSTFAVKADDQSEFLRNGGFVQPGLQVTYNVNDDFALMGELNYNTGTQQTTFSVGAKTNPEAIGNFFKGIGDSIRENRKK